MVFEIPIPAPLIGIREKGGLKFLYPIPIPALRLLFYRRFALPHDAPDTFHHPPVVLQ